MTMTTRQKVQFKKLHPEAQLPTYGTEEAAGADVRAVKDIVLMPGASGLIPTGLGCVIPPGWEIQARPRSGLAFKHAVTVLNSPGTIDSDYAGELGILLINHGNEPFVIAPGDRIAQIVLAPVWQADFEWTDASRDTERGAGGFGSTGTK
jgi:dUTP pyrophosphatase